MSKKTVDTVDLAVTTNRGTKVFGPMPERDAAVVQIVAAITGNTTSRRTAR